MTIQKKRGFNLTIPPPDPILAEIRNRELKEIQIMKEENQILNPSTATEESGLWIKDTATSTGDIKMKKSRKGDASVVDEDENLSVRERLKRHRVEVSREVVWIPDLWGQENFLKDWIDSSDFDSALAPQGIISARAALVEEGRTSLSGSITLGNSC